MKNQETKDLYRTILKKKLQAGAVDYLGVTISNQNA